MTKLTIFGTDIAFVSCHLAAHEGFVQRRNDDISEIVAETNRALNSRYSDIFHTYHHVFFFGDLNYRIQYEIEHGSDEQTEEEAHSECWDAVHALIEEEVGQ